MQHDLYFLEVFCSEPDWPADHHTPEKVAQRTKHRLYRNRANEVKMAMTYNNFENMTSRDKEKLYLIVDSLIELFPSKD